MTADKIVYLKKEYENIGQLARAYDVIPSQLKTYMEKYKNINKAMEKTIESSGSRKIVLYGRTFENLIDVANFYGVGYSKLSSWTSKKKVSIEEALEKTLNTGIVYKEKEYTSLHFLALEYDKHASTVYGRLQRGWSLEKALEEPVKANKCAEIYYKGQTFLSRSDLLRHYGISQNFVQSTVEAYGFDWEQTFEYIVSFLETCKGERPKIVTMIPYVIYNDSWFNTIDEFCQYLNVRRTRYNYSFKKAEKKDVLEIVKLLREQSKMKYMYEGKVHSYTDIHKLFEGKLETAVKKGEVERVKVFTNPDIKELTGYFKNAQYEFKDYMEKMLK